MKRTDESISLAGELTEITEVLRSADFIATYKEAAAAGAVRVLFYV